MKILLGYILTFGWVFLMLGVTQVLKTRWKLQDETSRKIIHVGVAFAWIPMYLCFGASIHLAIPTAVFIVLNAISYQKDLFSAMERSDSSRKSLGTVYYAVSMTVMAIWSWRIPECVTAYGVAVFCMALGDGFAPYFGSIRRGNRKLFGNRTLYGSISIFVICLLVVVIMTAIFHLPLTFPEMLTIAAAAVLFELVGVRGYDNLTLPLGVFLLTFFFIKT